MIIYNTLAKTKEELKPRNDRKIQMFVCGPTVYDYIHIGNARTFLFFDVVAKYIRHQGYEIDYIQNITDIDDKIIQRAKENNREPLEYAKEYYEKFKEDMKALGVDSAKYIPATEHIEQVIKQVKVLIDKNFAYKIDDGWYFDLSKFPEYGKLSGRKAQMADDAVSRIDENDQKRNKGDFCLWKFSKPDEPSWDTELGKGRPGWHIEDTAITEHHFGPQYDIHGGGQDLIFPHHEAEITQQESISGLKPFVKYWMHVAFLVNKDAKISKSLGNFETVNELLKKYPKQYLRYYLLSGHYRQPLEYNKESIQNFESTLSRLSNYYDQLKKINSEAPDSFSETIKNKEKEFYSAMDDDFNTPSALATIFELISETYQQVFEGNINKSSAQDIINFLDKMNNIFSIVIPSEKQEAADKIDKLRKEGKFKEATEKREEFVKEGYIVQTSVLGTTIIPGIEIKKNKPGIKIYKKENPEQ